MDLFRIDREKRRANALSGKGAELYGGRWNPIGTPVVYCSGSRALALLEILAHIRRYDDLPEDRIMIHLQIPKTMKVKRFSTSELPIHWNHPITEPQVQLFMKEHILNHCIIEVPSVIVPEENNYLINPLHAHFSQVKVKVIKALHFDHRLK